MEIEQSEEERAIVKWFRDDAIPKLLQQGHLKAGRNPRVVKCEFTITQRWTDHFASSPYFLTLETDSDEGRTVFDLFVKFALQDEKLRSKWNYDRQSYNETRIYNIVLPEFQKLLLTNPKGPQGIVDELCAKCYYCSMSEEDPKHSVWVLENLKKSNYRPAESKVFLDFEHCAVALKQLGRFHALSLALKTKFPDEMERLKDIFVEARYFDDPRVHESCEEFLHRCSQRAIDYLLSLENPPVPKDYIISFRKRISDVYRFMVSMLQPEEPLALITHGDYCRNNVMFRYEGERVVDAKMFDFQVARYCSPSIDLSFFVYLNTTQELRDKHMDELLQIYYSNLVSTAGDVLGVPHKDISDRFPFALFMDDFARHAAYAYILVSFFQCMMLGEFEMNWELSAREMADGLYSLGGEEVSRGIADVIVDFYKRKFYQT